MKNNTSGDRQGRGKDNLPTLSAEQRAELARRRFRLAATELKLELNARRAVRSRMKEFTTVAFVTGLACGLFPGLGKALLSGAMTATRAGMFANSARKVVEHLARKGS